MPLIDITNPKVIRFLTEATEKTDRLRMRWNDLYGQRLKKAAEFVGEQKGYYESDVIKEEMVTGMLATTRDHISSTRNRRTKRLTDLDQVLGISEFKKRYSIPEIGLGDPKDDPRLGRPDDDFSIDPVMRPVDPDQTELIHKGVPNFGREYYLKVRSKMDPEEKYYFDTCTSWEYGWRMGDSFFGRHAPSYRRNYLLTQDGMSRTGPQPDPDHYKWPEQPGPQKCT